MTANEIEAKLSEILARVIEISDKVSSLLQ